MQENRAFITKAKEVQKPTILLLMFLVISLPLATGNPVEYNPCVVDILLSR